MMLTLHFYRVYPVINSSMGDRRGKERPRSSGSLEFFFSFVGEIIGDLRRSKFLCRSAGKYVLLRALHCFDKNIVVLTPLPGRMRTILARTGEEGEERGRIHTRACSTGLHRSARSKAQVPFSTPACTDCRGHFSGVWKIFLSYLSFPRSLVDSFIHKGNRVSRMYTLTFATFLLYVHVYTMKRFLARLSVSS